MPNPISSSLLIACTSFVMIACGGNAESDSGGTGAASSGGVPTGGYRTGGSGPGATETGGNGSTTGGASAVPRGGAGGGGAPIGAAGDRTTTAGAAGQAGSGTTGGAGDGGETSGGASPGGRAASAGTTSGGTSTGGALGGSAGMPGSDVGSAGRPGGAGAGGDLGTNRAGAGGEPTGSAGSSGASAVGSACDPICGGDCAGQQPPCLPEAIGLTADGATDTCLAQDGTTLATWCSAHTCNGEAGCALTIQIGTVDWALDPQSGTIELTGTVTAVEGSIDVHAFGTTCDVTVNIPDDDPIAIAASGVLQPNGDVLVPSFSEVLVNDATASLVSAPGLCTTIAAAAQAEYQAGLAASLLAELEARAASLACLECRADCPGTVACM